MEAILEQQAQAPRRGYAIPPPEDVLIPPSRPTMASEMGPPEREGVKPPPVVLTEPQRGRHKEANRGGSKASSLSPDEDVQKRDRDAAIEAVRKINKTSGGTPNRWGVSANHSMNITGTPRYDWDAGYDGIQGFATQLRNRVSEPPTPQRRLSPRQMGTGGVNSPKGGSQVLGMGAPLDQSIHTGEGGPSVTPVVKKSLNTGEVMRTEQGQYPVGTPRQLLTYDETPTGRPLPTLREIRQANLR